MVARSFAVILSLCPGSCQVVPSPSAAPEAPSAAPSTDGGDVALARSVADLAARVEDLGRHVATLVKVLGEAPLRELHAELQRQRIALAQELVELERRLAPAHPVVAHKRHELQEVDRQIRNLPGAAPAAGPNQAGAMATAAESQRGNLFSRF